MNRHLTDSDVDVWAATEARYRPAAEPAEARDTYSGMRVIAWVLVITCVPLTTGVVALVRYLTR